MVLNPQQVQHIQQQQQQHQQPSINNNTTMANNNNIRPNPTSVGPGVLLNALAASRPNTPRQQPGK
jgi:hypothetical protein